MSTNLLQSVITNCACYQNLPPFSMETCILISDFFICDQPTLTRDGLTRAHISGESNPLCQGRHTKGSALTGEPCAQQNRKAVRWPKPGPDDHPKACPVGSRTFQESPPAGHQVFKHESFWRALHTKTMTAKLLCFY